MVVQTSKTKHNVGIEAILASEADCLKKKSYAKNLWQLNNHAINASHDRFVPSTKENSKLMNEIKIEAHSS